MGEAANSQIKNWIMCAVNVTTTTSPLPLPRLGRETFLHYAARCTRCWPVTMKFFCEWQSGASTSSSSGAAQQQQQHGQANAAAEAKAKQKAKQQNNRNAANETVMEENNKTKAPQFRERAPQIVREQQQQLIAARRRKSKESERR